MRKLKPIYVFLALVVILPWIAWADFAFRASGRMLLSSKIDNHSLQNLGSFGDAFGVVGSLMAALAAAAAFVAFLRQQEDNRDQEFERNFFTLLSNLQLIVSQIDITRYDTTDLRSKRRAIRDKDMEEIFVAARASLQPVKGSVSGRDALRILLNQLRWEINSPGKFRDSKQIHRAYDRIYSRRHDDLGHYFRTCYQIFKMIDEECPGGEQRQTRYVRLARSHLSSSEICLLAYNCSVGIGRFKFRRLANKYRIFHNFHVDGRGGFYKQEQLFFERMIGFEAFELDELDEFSYN